jgi:histidinol-phosphate aminotransferase
MKLSIDASIQRVPFYPKAALYGADAGWVRLSSNENPYPPSPAVMEAMADALLDVNRYPESEAELKGLIAKKYGLSPENILIGNGSNELIETACRALRTAGRTEVIVSAPSFAFYRIAANIYGYEVAAAPLDALRMDLDRIADMAGERTRLVFLCNPNNPTGTIFDDRAFGAFLDRLPPEALVVLDEAYAEFSDNKLFPRSITYIDRRPVLVMRTFSKAYGLAGLRIGYGIAEKSLVSFLERTKQPFSVNMMALVAAKAALGDERHVAFVLESIRKGRKYLHESLKGLGLDARPSEANFVLVRIGPDARALVDRLFDRKVLVRWLGGYGLPEYIRVTVGTMDENRVFIEALKRLA